MRYDPAVSGREPFGPEALQGLGAASGLRPEQIRAVHPSLTGHLVFETAQTIGAHRATGSSIVSPK